MVYIWNVSEMVTCPKKTQPSHTCYRISGDRSRHCHSIHGNDEQHLLRSSEGFINPHKVATFLLPLTVGNENTTHQHLLHTQHSKVQLSISHKWVRPTMWRINNQSELVIYLMADSMTLVSIPNGWHNIHRWGTIAQDIYWCPAINVVSHEEAQKWWVTEVNILV